MRAPILDCRIPIFDRRSTAESLVRNHQTARLSLKLFRAMEIKMVARTKDRRSADGPWPAMLWGERQIRSVANMMRSDARDFLNLAAEIHLQPKITTFALDQANEALAAIKSDSIDGAAVLIP